MLHMGFHVRWVHLIMINYTISHDGSELGIRPCYATKGIASRGTLYPCICLSFVQRL